MDVIYIDNFLSDEVLKTCQDYIDNFYGQGIIGDKNFVNNFWEENKEKIQNINSDWIGLYNNVTKTNNSEPVNKHLDKKIRNEKYKMFIYLNEVPNGGTIFFDGADEGDPVLGESLAALAAPHELDECTRPRRCHPVLKEALCDLRVDRLGRGIEQGAPRQDNELRMRERARDV